MLIDSVKTTTDNSFNINGRHTDSNDLEIDLGFRKSYIFNPDSPDPTDAFESKKNAERSIE